MSAFSAGRGAGEPVPRAFVAGIDRHGNSAGLQAELTRPLAREVEGRVPPPQNSRAAPAGGVGEDRENVALGVPEGVAVVAGAGQALGGDRRGLTRALPAGDGRSQTGPPGERRVAVVSSSALSQSRRGTRAAISATVPPRGDRDREAGRPGRAVPAPSDSCGPAVAENLVRVSRLPRARAPRPSAARGHARHGWAGQRSRGVDLVIHPGRQAKDPTAGRDARAPPGSLVGSARGTSAASSAAAARGSPPGRGTALIRKEVGLQRQPQISAEGLDLVIDGGHGALRNETRRRDVTITQGRRRHPQASDGVSVPDRKSSVRSCRPCARAQIDRLVLDQQADQLSVGHVDDGLAGLR